MTPAAEIAARIDEGNPDRLTFREDLALHLDHGWIYSSPTAFGLAMLKISDWGEDDLQNPEIYALPDDADLWYFTRVAGKAAEVFERLPFPMPFVGYQRFKTGKTIRLTYARFERLLYRSLRGRKTIGFH